MNINVGDYSREYNAFKKNEEIIKSPTENSENKIAPSEDLKNDLELPNIGELSSPEGILHQLNPTTLKQQKKQITADAEASIDEFSNQLLQIIDTNLNNPQYLSSLDLDPLKPKKAQFMDTAKAVKRTRKGLESITPSNAHSHSLLSPTGNLVLYLKLANLPDKMSALNQYEKLINQNNKKIENLKKDPEKNAAEIKKLTTKTNALVKKRMAIANQTYQTVVQQTLMAAKNDTSIAKLLSKSIGGSQSMTKLLTICGSIFSVNYQLFKIYQSVNSLKTCSKERNLIFNELEIIKKELKNPNLDPALKIVLQLREKSLDRQYIDSAHKSIESSLSLSCYTSAISTSGLTIAASTTTAAGIATLATAAGIATGTLLLSGVAIGGAYLAIRNREELKEGGKRLYTGIKLKIAKNKEEETLIKIQKNNAKANLMTIQTKKLKRSIRLHQAHISVLSNRHAETKNRIYQLNFHLNHFEKMTAVLKDLKNFQTENEEQDLQMQLETLKGKDLDLGIRNSIKTHLNHQLSLLKEKKLLNIQGDKEFISLINTTSPDNALKSIEPRLISIENSLNAEKRKKEPNQAVIEKLTEAQHYLNNKSDIYLKIKKLEQQIDQFNLVDKNMRSEFGKLKVNNLKNINRQIIRIRKMIHSQQNIKKLDYKQKESAEHTIAKYQVILNYLHDKKSYLVEGKRIAALKTRIKASEKNIEKYNSISKVIKSINEKILGFLKKFRATKLEKLSKRSKEHKSRKFYATCATDLGMSISAVRKQREELMKQLASSPEALQKFLYEIEGQETKEIDEDFIHKIFNYCRKKVM